MDRILFSPQAKSDLVEIGDYIAFQLRNKPAAKGVITRIREQIFSLVQFPESGTPIQFSGLNFVYRYLVCGNYMIFYHLTENAVYIDRILYGRRDYLSILFGNEFVSDD